MNSQPLISVIINCYNGEKYLKEAIDSVYSQSYQNFEIIFWDNNSNDKSSDIAKSYDKKLKYYYSKNTTSLGEARSKAIKKTSGDYITFLDVDDIYENNKFYKQINLMTKKNLLMCYGSIKFFKGNKTIWVRKAKNSTGNIFSNLLLDYEIHMNTVMISKKIFTYFNYRFNKTLQYSPDYNLFMKISLQHDIGVISEVIGNSRVHDRSLTNSLMDIIPEEHLFTINELQKRDPSIIEKYRKNLSYAINKTYYYEAISFIYSDEIKSARKVLLKIFYLDLKYFILFLLLLFPFNKNTILKILKR